MNYGKGGQNNTASQGAENTAGDDNPNTRTPEQMASIEEYKNSVDASMVNYIERVRNGEKLSPYNVAPVTNRAAADILRLTGKVTYGNTVVLDRNGIEHIDKRHGGGKGSADATMKNAEDIARIGYVLDNYDDVYLSKEREKGYLGSDGKTAPKVVFVKKIDGTYIAVEAVCDTKAKKNYVVSAFISSTGTDRLKIAEPQQTYNTRENPSPEVYAQDANAENSTNTSIASSGQNVNTQTTEGEDWILNYDMDGQNNTASTTETGSTVINDNPAVHTAEENANIAKYSAAANEAFNAATAQQVRIDDIAGKISEALGVPYTPGKQKSVNSIISRLSRNEARGKGSDWHDLKDLARTHIEMKSWDDIPRVLSMLDEMGIPYTASAKNTKLGYKGVHITWFENGVGHELQLSTPEAWAIKQKTEEIYAKWRDLEADHNFVRPPEYYSDIAQSKEMWNQLNLPDFSRFATSSGVSNLASSSKSSPRNMLERSLPQRPSANSASGLPGSSFIMRPDSVNITSTEKTSNNTVSPGSSILSTTQNVNTQTDSNIPGQDVPYLFVKSSVALNLS